MNQVKKLINVIAKSSGKFGELKDMVYVHKVYKGKMEVMKIMNQLS